MAHKTDAASIVYLVAGEFCFSENGEVAWQEGIYRTKESARLAARSAADAEDERRCLVDGRPYGLNWDCSCESREHGSDCEADGSDWDISFEVLAMPVLD
jgi:hypothetical protein